MMTKFLFSTRTDWVSSMNTISQALERLREKKVSIFDLTESNPSRCRFSSLNENLIKSLKKKENLVYAPDPRGLREVREEIAAYYHSQRITINPSQIFLTSSTSEGYSFLFRLLTNPAEKILLPRPSYPLFQFLADLNDINVEFYPLVFSHRWMIDFDALVNLIDSQTKAIIVVNPNNPTGSYLTDAEMARLREICHDKNVALISDEVFFDYALNKPRDARSLVQESAGLNFCLGGISKTLALPQMKLSWIIVNGEEKLVEEACQRLEIIADTYLSVNTPVQRAFGDWMKKRGEIQHDLISRLKCNFQVLQQELAKLKSCKLLETEGGWYALVQIPPHYSEEEWVLRFMSEDHVFVHPGYFFDFDEGTQIIVSLLPQKDVFKEGVKRICARIAAC
jgi:aspartate/methionine/tyrosine aminotransferase